MNIFEDNFFLFLLLFFVNTTNIFYSICKQYQHCSSKKYVKITHFAIYMYTKTKQKTCNPSAIAPSSFSRSLNN